jgi:hypothetical protein
MDIYIILIYFEAFKMHTAQVIKSDKIAFYACALKLWQSHNLTVDNRIG